MIIFVRHGQTGGNRAGQLQGRVDTELTDLGRDQAKRLADALSSVEVDHVVSSPLQRASETADAVASAHGLPVDVDDRLVELDYGEWDGRRFADVSAADWDAWRADAAFTPPGGESLVDVTARVRSFCASVPPDQMWVAVSHVSPIKAAVCLALGVDERASWRCHLDLASITRIGQRDAGIYLASFNETSHLS